MTIWIAFVVAFSPLVFSLVIAHRDERRAREFDEMDERREGARNALRQPYVFRGASR